MSEAQLNEFAVKIWEFSNETRKIAMSNTQVLAVLARAITAVSPDQREPILEALSEMRDHGEDNDYVAQWVYEMLDCALSPTPKSPPSLVSNLLPPHLTVIK